MPRLSQITVDTGDIRKCEHDCWPRPRSRPPPCLWWRRAPRRPTTRSRSASCTRCPAPWRSARRRSKDVMLMLIEEQNKKGGVLGKKLEAGGRRPGLELAAVRREGARADREGQGGGHLRLLDLGQPQVGAAGVRGAEQHPVLPRPVRGRGEQQERLLHRRRPEPAGHPRRRLPDERGGRRALGAGRHRLRLPAHDQQDPRGLPASRRAWPPRTS